MSKKRAALGAADDVFGSRVFESSTIFVTVVHNREYHAFYGISQNKQASKFLLDIFNFVRSGLE